jgi:hypothetical protein
MYKTYESAVSAYERALQLGDRTLIVAAMEALHLLGRGQRNNPAAFELIARVRALEPLRIEILGKNFSMPGAQVSLTDKLARVRYRS